MRNRLLVLIAAVLASIASSMPADASLPDFDGDLVPDPVDNCTTVANGPNQTSNQIDFDLDGYGTRCDADYDNSGTTTIADFALLLQCLSSGYATCLEMDHDGSESVTGADFAVFIGKFQSVGERNHPGPSGLRCAGTAPCPEYVRDSIGPNVSHTTNTPGTPNDYASPSDFDIVTFEVPAGHPGQVMLLQMVTGAPGGACAGGSQCYAGGTYTLAGWSDSAEAESSPTVGTLFNVDVSNVLAILTQWGTTNDGIPAGPTFPNSLLTFVPDGLGAVCPATGCVIALISDVGAAPGLVVDTRSSTYLAPGPSDRALCPVGCEGGVPVGTMAVRYSILP